MLGAWTAWACHKAQRHGLPGSDAVVWAGLAAVFLLFSQTKLARVPRMDEGVGSSGCGRWRGSTSLYAGRRPFQIAATVVVALIVAVLLVIGLLWMWHAHQALSPGHRLCRPGGGVWRHSFHLLHEVDAWNAAMPWARVVVELTAAAGASAVAVARLRQLGEIARLRPPG